MTHPPSFRLDALAAGDVDAATRDHVAACDPCATYVRALEAEVSAFRSANDAGAFAEQVAERARPKRSVTVLRLTYYLAPTLAAAAGFALWVGHEPPAVPHASVGMGTVVATPGDPPPMLHFKGGLSVAVFRERRGVQARLSGPLEVLPGDRIRVEVAVDRAEPITAGLLAADGTWTPLLAAAELSVGTHLSELAARFDNGLTDDVLLVGPPDAVASARVTRRFEGIVAWSVRSQPRE